MSRSYRQQKLILNLDLNSAPPVETETSPREGPSTGVPLLPMIRVQAIDDEVIESSPRAFAQAKSNARRIGRRTVAEADSENQNIPVTYEANSLNLQTLNDFYVDLGPGSVIRPVNEPEPEPEPESEPEPEPKEPTPEPPKPLVFDCPICMGPLEEEVTTRCGHIFCKMCIKTAIRIMGKCPTCRKRITARTLIRVFLPSAN